jgi:hypothetical protein
MGETQMSLTTMNELAYDTWEPGLNDMLEHEEGYLYSWLEKTNKDVRGRNVFVKLKTGRSTGISNIAEGGDFPAAGDPTYDEAEIELSRIAATCEFTLDEVDMLDGRDAAAEAVVEEKLEDLVNTVRRDCVRQLWSDGSAKLARIASVSGSTGTLSAVTDSASASQYDRDRFLWLEEDGLKVDMVHGTTGVVTHAGLTIDDIVESTNVVTFGSSVASGTSSHVLVRSGNSTASGGAYVSREIAGLQAAIDNDNTYLTLNRASAGFRFWKAQVITGDTAGVLQPITHDRVLKLINRVTKKRGTSPTLSKDYVFMSNLGVWSAYGEMLQGGVRYKAMEELDFGWPTLQIFGTKFHADIHAPNNRLYLIHKPGFGIRRPKYRKRPLFRFMNDDGSMWRYKRAASGGGISAAIQSNLTGMMTLVTERPNVHGMLDDIDEVGV